MRQSIFKMHLRNEWLVQIFSFRTETFTIFKYMCLYIRFLFYKALCEAVFHDSHSRKLNDKHSEKPRPLSVFSNNNIQLTGQGRYHAVYRLRR